MKRSQIVLLGVALLGASVPAWVHHSGAMFDRNKQIEIEGAIKEFNWTNPHSSFKVDVPNATGKLETWAIEMNSPNNLVREGWKRTTLKAGDKVKVTINPLRDGKPGGWYVAITLPDGKTLSTEAAPDGRKPAGSSTY
jgi:Family of unknown function (DUF6152)